MCSSESVDLGFRIIPSVLTAEECTALAGTLSRGNLARTRAGLRHLLSVPTVARLASGRRLLDIASSFLGDDAYPFRATLFEKSSVANWLVPWHQDTTVPLRRRFHAAGWGPWSEKAGVLHAHAPAPILARIIALRVHLDDSTATNGPLRVVPGSHLLGVMADEAVAGLAHASPIVECIVPKGGVLVMRPLLIHSSSKSLSRAPRRVLHIEYADSMELGGGVRLAVA